MKRRQNRVDGLQNLMRRVVLVITMIRLLMKLPGKSLTIYERVAGWKRQGGRVYSDVLKH